MKDYTLWEMFIDRLLSILDVALDVFKFTIYTVWLISLFWMVYSAVRLVIWIEFLPL